MSKWAKGVHSPIKDKTQERTYLTPNQDLRGTGDPYALQADYKAASLPLDPAKLPGSGVQMAAIPSPIKDKYIQIPAGSLAAPGLSGVADTDTGVRIPGGSGVQIVVDATAELEVTEDGVTINGRLAIKALTPAQITANQDNYDPDASDESSFWRLSTDASRTITGFAGGADGRLLIIANVGSFNIVLAEQTTSTAANQIITGTGANIIVEPLKFAKLIYDATSSRWRVMDIRWLTTKGDVQIHNGSDVTRMAVGADGGAFVAESTVTNGLRYDFLTGFVMPELGWELDGDLDVGSGTVTLTGHNIRQYGTLNLNTGTLNTAAGSLPTFAVFFCADLLTSTSGTLNLVATSLTPAGTSGGAGAAGGGSGGAGGEPGGALYIYAYRITGTGTAVASALTNAVAGSNATAATGTGNGNTSANPTQTNIRLWNGTSTTIGTSTYTFNAAANGGGQSSGTGGSARSGASTGWTEPVKAAIRDCSAMQHFAGFGYGGAVGIGNQYRAFHMCGGGGGGAGGRNNGGAQGAGGGGASNAAPPWPMGATYDALQDGQAGGAGGAGGSGAGGGAGGSGATGGLIRVRAYSIASTWTFRANGSNGGNGGNGNGYGGGGAGGNGGDGGCVILETLNATTCTVTVAGGTKGTGGSPGASGGSSGTNGLDGRTGVSIAMRMRAAAA